MILKYYKGRSLLCYYLNPQLSTLNSQPSTLNSQPSTLNLQLSLSQLQFPFLFLAPGISEEGKEAGDVGDSLLGFLGDCFLLEA